MAADNLSIFLTTVVMAKRVHGEAAASSPDSVLCVMRALSTSSTPRQPSKKQRSRLMVASSPEALLQIENTDPRTLALAKSCRGSAVSARKVLNFCTTQSLQVIIASNDDIKINDNAY